MKHDSLLGPLPCVKNKKETRARTSVAVLCVRNPHLNFRNGWTILNETWYEHDAMGGNPTTTLFNFLQSLRTTWQTREILRWERHLPPLLFSEMLHGDRLCQNMHVCSVKLQHGDSEFLQRSGL